MKIIFLDVEGVLNTKETYERIRREKGNSIMIDAEIDGFRLGYLKQIIDATDAKVVLSSAWKKDFENINGNIVPIHENTMIINVFFKPRRTLPFTNAVL